MRSRTVVTICGREWPSGALIWPEVKSNRRRPEAACTMLYRGMDPAQLDAAYNNSAAVPERGAIAADWAARSARVRRESAGRLDLAYAETPRERLDLFLADDPKAPTLALSTTATGR